MTFSLCEMFNSDCCFWYILWAVSSSVMLHV
jgi:hypothetical protein